MFTNITVIIIPYYCRLLLRAITHNDLQLQGVVDLSCGSLVQSPLHTAAKSAKVKAVKMLLEAEANPNVTEFRGFTPLHLASKVGNTEVASLLIDYGADPDAKGKGRYEKTPLHRARKPGMVRTLLDHGANPYETMAFKLGVVYDTVDSGYGKGDGEEGIGREVTINKSALDVLMWRNPNAAAEVM